MSVDARVEALRLRLLSAKLGSMANPRVQLPGSEKNAPGCSLRNLVTSYTFPAMMIQQSVSVLCFATSAAVKVFDMTERKRERERERERESRGPRLGSEAYRRIDAVLMSQVQ